MIKQSLIIILTIFVLVPGCNKPESKYTQASKALGVEIKQSCDFDIQNIDHLVFLHKHATEQEKQTAQDMMRAAYDAMLMEPRAFPLIQYHEALMNYPTIATLLGTANGYLRMADLALEMTQGDLSKTDGSGNASPQAYYELASKYYSLTLEFSKSLNIPIDANQNEDSIYSIENTIKCIQVKIDIANPKPEKVCGEVYDVSLPPALLELKSK